MARTTPCCPRAACWACQSGACCTPCALSPELTGLQAQARSAGSHVTAWALGRPSAAFAAHAKHAPIAGVWDIERTSCLGTVLYHGALGTRSSDVTHTDNRPAEFRLFQGQDLDEPVLKGPVLRAWIQEGLVALWVTNRERLRRFVDAELLPAWGLVPAALWFWLKVTARGALVTPLVIPLLGLRSRCQG